MMAVGNQATKASMDQTMSACAVQLRVIMDTVNARWTFINNGAYGTPVEVLTAIGYDNTNTDAPGNQSDASYASYLLGQMYQLSQVYYGQAVQGSEYNFNGALATLWAAT